MAAAAALRLTAAPRLEIDPGQFDFGTVPDDTRQHHVFTLRNGGDANLVIGQVRPECAACTRTRLERNVIPPGESAALEVMFDPDGFEGPVHKLTEIESNDAGRPRQLLAIAARVAVNFAKSPRQIIFPAAGAGGAPPVAMRIVPRQKLSAPLSVVESDCDRFSGEVTADGDAFVLRVRMVGPSGPAGTQGILRVRSAAAGDPVCAVRVLALSPQALGVIPLALSFNGGGAPQQRVVLVRQTGGCPVSLLDAVPPSTNFACEIYPEPGGANYRVYVSSRGALSAADAGNLVLRTADTNAPEIPVRISIRDSTSP